ncbi:hypothetical protein QPK87_19145 [Kamptonema cortianum]|nr:hypothetical protein [Kamptonema cortianum]
MTILLTLAAYSAAPQIQIPNLGTATQVRVPYELLQNQTASPLQIIVSNDGTKAFNTTRENDGDTLWMWQLRGSRDCVAKLRHFYNPDTKKAFIQWPVEGKMDGPEGSVALSAWSRLVALGDGNTAYLWREGRGPTGLTSSTLSYVKMSEEGPTEGKVLLFSKEKMQFVAVNTKEKYVAVRTPAYESGSRLRVFSFKNQGQQGEEIPVPQDIAYLKDVRSPNGMPSSRSVSSELKWAVEDGAEINLASGKRTPIPKVDTGLRVFFYIGEELFFRPSDIKRYVKRTLAMEPHEAGSYEDRCVGIFGGKRQWSVYGSPEIFFSTERSRVGDG